MRKFGVFIIAIVGMLIGLSGVVGGSPFLNRAVPESEYEMLIKAHDESAIPLCKPGSLIEEQLAPLFDENGPQAATPEEAASRLIENISTASTPDNPELKELPEDKREAYVRWFEADFQAARSLTIGDMTEGIEGSARFNRRIPGDHDIFDVHIQTKQHRNGRFYVSYAAICADAIHDREFLEDAPDFVKAGSEEPGTEDPKDPNPGSTETKED